MKKTVILFSLLLLFKLQSHAQSEYGKTLNLGIGLGYYKYFNHSTGVFHANYELDVAKNFTLAPFISYYSYGNDYYWGSPNHPYKYYHYRETVIPFGVKGSYYFDDMLDASSDWDFYLAGSLGLALVKTHWDSDYDGDKYIYRTRRSGTTPLYLDVHVGAEYHVSDKIGLFLDLSTGVSTFGVAIH